MSLQVLARRQLLKSLQVEQSLATEYQWYLPTVEHAIFISGMVRALFSTSGAIIYLKIIFTKAKVDTW